MYVVILIKYEVGEFIDLIVFLEIYNLSSSSFVKSEVKNGKVWFWNIRFNVFLVRVVVVFFVFFLSFDLFLYNV